MAISLTQEEFLDRLLTRQPLLEIAIDEDIKAIFPITMKVDTNQTEIHMDWTKPVSEVVQKVMVRVITLVYDEGLD